MTSVFRPNDLPESSQRALDNAVAQIRSGFPGSRVSLIVEGDDAAGAKIEEANGRHSWRLKDGGGWFMRKARFKT